MSCLAAIDYCICTRAAEHDGAHRCDCGGEWDYRGGKFVVERFPGEAGERYGGDVIAALVGFLGLEDEDDE